MSKSLKTAYFNNGDAIKNKRNSTFKKIYGEDVISPFELSSVKASIENTILKKFGVKNVFYLKEFRSDGRKASQNKSVLHNNFFGYDIEYIDKNFIKIKNLCSIHGDVEMKANDFYNKTYRNRNDAQCVVCNPILSFSSFELNFSEMLNELGINNFKKNTKKVIFPYEIDFFFPDKLVAIELNGVYWHSELYKDKNYHKIKSDLCEKGGIKLIHIWEDDFYNKPEIIKSILSNFFKLNTNTIYARKCQIKEISSKDYISFLIDNHLQGKVNSSIRLGLYHNDELISVMGLGKLRLALGQKTVNGTYELHRFCTKQNISIPGGASKLLNYFENNFEYEKIISYAKRDYSSGDLYEKLGFTYVKKCDPGYYWIIDGNRKHRFNYRKNKISTKENKDKTGIEIMHEKGYIRCYDSGNLLYEKINVKR